MRKKLFSIGPLALLAFGAVAGAAPVLSESHGSVTAFAAAGGVFTIALAVYLGE